MRLRAEQKIRANRWLRSLVVIAAVCAFVALLFAFEAWKAQKEAEDALSQAHIEKDQAEAYSLEARKAQKEAEDALSQAHIEKDQAEAYSLEARKAQKEAEDALSQAQKKAEDALSQVPIEKGMYEYDLLSKPRLPPGDVRLSKPRLPPGDVGAKPPEHYALPPVDVEFPRAP